MLNRVVLNGSFVDSNTINPTMHRIVGFFRPPLMQMEKDDNNPWYCNGCNQVMTSWSSRRNHWMSGCLDIPQYADIGSASALFSGNIERHLYPEKKSAWFVIERADNNYWSPLIGYPAEECIHHSIDLARRSIEKVRADNKIGFFGPVKYRISRYYFEGVEE